jgi:uncharacterized protein (TIGR03437 family)
LGPDTLEQVSSFPLPTKLAGTSVQVVSGGTSLDCPMVYTSSAQVAAILPSATPVGQAFVIVTYNGLSTGVPDLYYGPYINVVPSSVGIYTLNSAGNGPGIFTTANGSVTDFVKTAKPGDVLTLWATGIGPIMGDDASPPEAHNFPDVQVYVGAQAAKVFYAGPSPCCAGLDQISFEVPPVVDSCFMPVLVSSGGIASNAATLSVDRLNKPCSDSGTAIPLGIYSRASSGEDVKAGTLILGPAGFMGHVGFDSAQFLAAKLSAALHMNVSRRDAAALLEARQVKDERKIRRVMWKYAKRWNALDPRVKKVLIGQANLSQDAASAAFGTLSSTSGLMAIFASGSPPEGACTIVQNVPNLLPVRSRAADAGSALTLNGPIGSVSLRLVAGGQYQGLFGDSVKGPNVPPGVYTITGKGGKDIGSFTATLRIGANLAWTNKAGTEVLDRTQPLTVNWTGDITTPGHVLIGGYQSGGRSFFCTEDVTKGAFTVPSVFVSAFKLDSGPVTLFLGRHPMERQVTIPGLDLAWFIDASSDSITVPLK